jgi:hypothetical protein
MASGYPLGIVKPFLLFMFVYIGCRGEDCMGGLTTTCAMSCYHHSICEFECRLWRGVLDTTLCDIGCQ